MSVCGSLIFCVAVPDSSLRVPKYDIASKENMILRVFGLANWWRFSYNIGGKVLGFCGLWVMVDCGFLWIAKQGALKWSPVRKLGKLWRFPCGTR